MHQRKRINLLFLKNGLVAVRHEIYFWDDIELAIWFAENFIECCEEGKHIPWIIFQVDLSGLDYALIDDWASENLKDDWGYKGTSNGSGYIININVPPERLTVIQES